eukprot:gene2659-3299_t
MQQQQKRNYTLRSKTLNNSDMDPNDASLQEVTFKELFDMADYETAHLLIQPPKSTTTTPVNGEDTTTNIPDVQLQFKPFPEAIEKVAQKPQIALLRVPEGTMKMHWIDRLASLMWLPIIGIIGYFLLRDDKANSKPLIAAKEYSSMDEDHVHITFDDVKGIEEVKSELVEIVDYLKNPEKYEQIGAKLPKGILMSGEPGTGKTLLARAIAGEADVPFLYTTGSSFDEKYIGVGAKRIRELFEVAKSKQPCIIFIDEIDSVGRERNSTRYNETLLQLLSEMDGFSQNSRILIIGATNTPDALDPALTRPGRFDRHIPVPIPDLNGRKEIVQYYLSKISHDPEEVKPVDIAKTTSGFTGADLSNLINTAAIKTVLNGETKVSFRMIEEARDDIIMGRARTSSIICEETRKNTAYHEAGHALIAALTDSADPIHKATIVPRGRALGMVSQVLEADRHQYTRKQMMARLAVCMAGRAAEEIFFGNDNVTSGATSDFQQATNLAYAMITKWGMSDKLGFTYLEGQSKMSPQVQSVVDSEVKVLLESQYQYAKDLILKNKDQMEKLAKELLEKETLSGDEVYSIVGATKPKIPSFSIKTKQPPQQQQQQHQ